MHKDRLTAKEARPTAPLGASLIVVSSLFYASYGIWTKLMGNFFGGYTASALRSILVLIILVPIALACRQLQPMRWRHTWRWLTALLVSSLFVWGPLYFAILHAGVGISLAINYASMVIGMFFFGRLFAKERLTKDRWVATILGLIGLCLIFSPTSSGAGWIALSAAALAGCSSASIYVIAKKLPYNATQSTVVIWVMSAVANVFMAVLIGEHRPAIGWHIQWLYLVFFALASVAASWLFVKGVKLIDAGAAGILGLLEIVFGVAFGVTFFHERLRFSVVGGVAVIIAAASIPYLKDYRAKLGTMD